jgi:PEP-CTERM motif
MNNRVAAIVAAIGALLAPTLASAGVYDFTIDALPSPPDHFTGTLDVAGMFTGVANASGIIDLSALTDLSIITTGDISATETFAELQTASQAAFSYDTLTGAFDLGFYGMTAGPLYSLDCEGPTYSCAVDNPLTFSNNVYANTGLITSVSVTPQTSVPEPSSFALLAVGIAGFAFSRRKARPAA